MPCAIFVQGICSSRGPSTAVMFAHADASWHDSMQLCAFTLSPCCLQCLCYHMCRWDSGNLHNAASCNSPTRPLLCAVSVPGYSWHLRLLQACCALCCLEQLDTALYLQPLPLWQLCISLPVAPKHLGELVCRQVVLLHVARTWEQKYNRTIPASATMCIVETSKHKLLQCRWA